VREEVRAVLGQMEGTPRLMASLLYGSGLRSGTREAGGECVRLRIKDLDFDRRQVFVREGKEGPGDDAPRSLSQPPRRQRKKTRRLHDEDLAAECGVVYLCSVELEAAVEDEVYHTDANAQQ
jgi:integrase